MGINQKVSFCTLPPSFFLLRNPLFIKIKCSHHNRFGRHCLDVHLRLLQNKESFMTIGNKDDTKEQRMQNIRFVPNVRTASSARTTSRTASSHRPAARTSSQTRYRPRRPHGASHTHGRAALPRLHFRCQAVVAHHPVDAQLRVGAPPAPVALSHAARPQPAPPGPHPEQREQHPHPLDLRDQVATRRGAGFPENGFFQRSARRMKTNIRTIKTRSTRCLSSTGRRSRTSTT